MHLAGASPRRLTPEVAVNVTTFVLDVLTSVDTNTYQATEDTEH